MQATFPGAGLYTRRNEMLAAGFYNMDCMEALKEYPDGYFDLAVVDPPYGDGNSGGGIADSLRADGSADTSRR